MGGWHLEIFKMAMYMTFPVAMFHYFNQPEYFEKWVTETKRQLYPPEKKGHRDEIENTIRSMREKHDKEIINALAEYENNGK